MPAKFVKALNGLGQMPVPFLVNNNQTILRGYILQISNGKVSVAGDAQAAGTVAGVALEDITTTTATDADIVLVDANPQSVYNMDWTTASTNTPAIGAAYDLGANAGVFDADDTSGGYIRVVGNVGESTADVMVGNRFNNVG